MKLNTAIWKNQEEFDWAYGIYINTRKRKLKYCEIDIGKGKWASMSAHHKRLKGGYEKKKRKPRKPRLRKEKIDYKKYILSKDRKNKRYRRIKAYMDKCECCQELFYNAFLCLHHHTYKRLGKEKDTDLAVVCKDCHYKIHFEEGVKMPLKEKILRARYENIKKK